MQRLRLQRSAEIYTDKLLPDRMLTLFETAGHRDAPACCGKESEHLWLLPADTL